MGPTKEVVIAGHTFTLSFVPDTYPLWRAEVPNAILHSLESDTGIDIAVVTADLAKYGEYATYRAHWSGNTTLTLYVTQGQL